MNKQELVRQLRDRIDRIIEDRYLPLLWGVIWNSDLACAIEAAAKNTLDPPTPTQGWRIRVLTKAIRMVVAGPDA